MSNTQKFTRVFGAVYLLVGILGFIPAVGGSTSQEVHKLLGIFGVNVLHNIVHLGVGAAFVAGSVSDSAARTVAVVIGLVYLLVGIVGIFSLQSLLGINVADDGLHLGTAALSLYFGLSGKTAANTSTA